MWRWTSRDISFRTNADNHFKEERCYSKDQTDVFGSVLLLLCSRQNYDSQNQISEEILTFTSMKSASIINEDLNFRTYSWVNIFYCLLLQFVNLPETYLSLKILNITVHKNADTSHTIPERVYNANEGLFLQSRSLCGGVNIIFYLKTSLQHTNTS